MNCAVKEAVANPKVLDGTYEEIMAITGHANLSEVTLYTAGADQGRLADEAMRKLEKGTKVSTRRRPVRQSGSQ